MRIKTAGFAGTNITYPFKQDILPLLDAVDPEAAQIGAINTVAIAPDGRTTGYNFDRRGWRRSFEERLGRDSARGRNRRAGRRRRRRARGRLCPDGSGRRGARRS